MYISTYYIHCKRLVFCSLYLIRIPIETGVKGIRIAYINIRNHYDLSKEMTKEMGLKCLILRPIMILGDISSGAAGSRTPVQTRNLYVFYMLSQSLVFVKGPAKDYKPNP